MADQVAVLDRGRIEQIGAPEELYDAPASAFVADFLGEANLFEGVIEPGSLRLPDGTSLPGLVQGAGAGRGRLAVRPGRVRLGPGGTVPATVVETIYAGETTAIVLRLASDRRLIARMPPDEAAHFPRGSVVRAGWAAADARIFASP